MTDTICEDPYIGDRLWVIREGPENPPAAPGCSSCGNSYVNTVPPWNETCDDGNIDDLDGCDSDGFNKDGYDRLGYDHLGYNKEGYNKDGYNKFNKNKIEVKND